MCINVIKGTTDPKLPFYMEGGSFCMNATTRFLSTVSEEEKGRTRNVCNDFGYESVALIPIRLGDQVLGLIHVADPKENMVPIEMVQMLEKEAIQLGIAFKRFWAEEQLKSSRDQLRNLSAHLETVREQERSRISREIEHELGQTLLVLKMELSLLGDRLPRDQKSLLEKTKSMTKLVDTTVQGVQRISAELRPALLDHLGLTAAIEWQAKEFQNRTGIKCGVAIDPEDIILDKDRSTAIFRIFQETLANVASHANATKAEVSLKEKSGKVVLRVRDNGKGITKKQISDPQSLGLIGIREHAHHWGGEVKIIGVRDKGTTVIVSIPLDKKRETRS